MAIEPGQEHDACLVVPRGRAKNLARQRHRGIQQFPEASAAALGQFGQRHGRHRGDGVEDAQQAVGVAALTGCRPIAGHEFGVVEIVTRVHLHARRQPAAQRPLPLRIEQRYLDAFDLGRLRCDQRGDGIKGLHQVRTAPVAAQRRVEHLAEPVQHHGLVGRVQQPVIELQIVLRAARGLDQGAAGHEDHGAAFGLHHVHLLAEGQRRLPIDGRRAIPGMRGGQRVDHHMGRCVDAAVEGRGRARGSDGIGFHGQWYETAVASGKEDLHGGLLPQARWPRMWSAAFSATMMVGALVLHEGMKGITDASATRSPSMPMSCSCGVTTLYGSCSGPMRQVPTGWWSVLAWAQA